MTNAGEPIPRKPLRLWPGVAIVVLMGLVRFGLPMVWPDGLEYCIVGELVGTLAIVVWWAFFSRAPLVERWGAVVLMIAAMAATKRILLDPSIATGAMGMLFFIYAIPVLGVAFVVWAVGTSRLSDRVRRVTMVGTVLLASGGWALLRTGGITANVVSDFAWRWAPTAEDRLLARANEKPAAATVAPPAGNQPTAITPAPVAAKPPGGVLTSAPASMPSSTTMALEPASAAAVSGAASGINQGAEWPGFRGPHRDGVVPGVRIETNWQASPPVQMWRQPVGPGWSSFAVSGNLIYTQEQRGSDEVVACYKLSTGEPVWRHSDAARFWESNAGAGPRATPTLSNGRVYTFGATGIVNVLDAHSGAVVWSHNAGVDTATKIPEWGFSSSPLVLEDLVIVGVSGKLAAYDLSTGKPRWLATTGGGSYSSPHLMTIGGVEQILLMNGAGVTSVAPADGKVLWNHAWRGFTIVQPALTEDGGVLISTGGDGGGAGTRRLAVAKGPGGWKVDEVWTSTGLKPYFNDFVVHNGHAFGFDGSILSCIDLKDGTRKWKGGRYGNGQLILLPEQDLLVVLSEEGELALVAAAPDQFKELARFKAIEGKTWNHPVLAGGVLLVRNGEEMAAFRVSLARR
jgi:outer membrane protein assembly factor BamB